MPGKTAHVKNEKQYEALKDKGMSKERAAKIANSPDASRHGGESPIRRRRIRRPSKAARPLRRRRRAERAARRRRTSADGRRQFRG